MHGSQVDKCTDYERTFLGRSWMYVPEVLPKYYARGSQVKLQTRGGLQQWKNGWPWLLSVSLPENSARALRIHWFDKYSDSDQQVPNLGTKSDNETMAAPTSSTGLTNSCQDSRTVTSQEEVFLTSVLLWLLVFVVVICSDGITLLWTPGDARPQSV